MGHERRIIWVLCCKPWGNGKAARRGWRRRRKAYEAALLERTREKVPLDWAMTQENLALVALAFWDQTRDAAHLDTAEANAFAAQAVYQEAEAGFFIEKVARLLSAIAQARGAG